VLESKKELRVLPRLVYGRSSCDQRHHEVFRWITKLDAQPATTLRHAWLTSNARRVVSPWKSDNTGNLKPAEFENETTASGDTQGSFLM